MHKEDPDFVTALARGMRILTCFQANDVELGNGEIAHRAGLPPATVARLTYTLTQLGYLRNIPLRRKYALSANVLSIGHPVLASLPERDLARMHLKQLANDSHGSVCLAIAEGLHAVYIEASHGTEGSPLSDIGTHRALLDSSVGRALYVAMESAQQTAVLNQLCLISPQRETDLRRIAQQAQADFGRYGMCRSEGVVRPGWTGVAMPLRGLAGRHLAISLGIRTESLQGDADLRRPSLALAAAASRIAAAFQAADRSATRPAAHQPTTLP